jgi:hypothetical protein
MRRKTMRAVLVALTAFTLAFVAAAPATAGPVQITIRGVVTEGVEAGCLVMTPATPVTYLLLGGDPNVVVPGANLEVTGHVVNISTTCQQGTPLQVDSAKPI